MQGAGFGTGTKVTSTTVTLSQPVGAGDLLVGWFSQYKVAGNLGVSDNANGAWTRSPGSLPFGSSGDNALYYLAGSAASPAGTTITITAPSAAYLQGTVAEYSGVDTTAPLEAVAVGSGVSTAVRTATTNAVSAGDLVYSALVTGSSAGGDTPGSSAGVGYTARAAIASGSAYEQDITSSAAGAQVGAATLGEIGGLVRRGRGVPPSHVRCLAAAAERAERVGADGGDGFAGAVELDGGHGQRSDHRLHRVSGRGQGRHRCRHQLHRHHSERREQLQLHRQCHQQRRPGGPEVGPLAVTTPGASPLPPSAPSGLAQTGVTASQVQLSWTAATDNVPITGYTVYRDGAKVGTAAGTSYTDTTVSAASSYSYTVSATNNAGQEGPKSSPLAVTTPGGAGPCSLPGLIADIASANSGSGGGTITLQSSCDYVLTSVNNSAQGGNGLPVITGDVTIQGNGATIERSSAGGTPHFRLFDVATGAKLTLTDLTLSNGIADNGSDGGGAIWNHGTLSVTGSTFTKNTNPATTGTSGGAIQNSGSATVTRCIFTDNTAMEGGAVFNQSSFTIRQSTFTNNTATVYGGGAILNAFGTTTVDGSTFVGNSGPGGGVLDNDTTVNISNSTMYNNVGGSHGGGAVQNFGTVNLTTSTLSGNSSPYGANIYNYGSSVLTVSSTIVTAGAGGSNCGGTAIIDGGHNLDSGASCSFGAAQHSVSNTNPQLQPLAANGGPTQTMALTPGSAAIDVIPGSTAGCAGTTDQRGTGRPQGPACDIGAYELLSSGNDTQSPTTPTGLTATASDPGHVMTDLEGVDRQRRRGLLHGLPRRHRHRDDAGQHGDLHRRHRGGHHDLPLLRRRLRRRRQRLHAVVPAVGDNYERTAPGAPPRAGCRRGDRQQGDQHGGAARGTGDGR